MATLWEPIKNRAPRKVGPSAHARQRLGAYELTSYILGSLGSLVPFPR
jgi:hypothetical protein